MAEIDLLPLPGEPTPSPILSRQPQATARPAVRTSRFGTWWRNFPNAWTLWPLLLIITGIGAFLRFWRLDHQAYWTDEAHTLVRLEVQGSYQGMLQNVGGQLFPPGWYSMLRWWCELWAQHFVHGGATQKLAIGMSVVPSITRSLAAIFGTLTIPGMYFLARQFTDRKGALLVMLLAAVNPFFVYYSRDIKMYSAVFFFVTLNSAVFFQWMSSGKHALWMPLYAITGFCMMAVDLPCAFMLGLHFIFLLTRPRPRAWDAALWIIAVGLIAWFPAYWKINYMSDAQVQEAMESSNDVHLAWITRYTDMNWKTVAGLPTAHVLGYLWPEYPPGDKINEWFDLDYVQGVDPTDPAPAGSPSFNHNLATRSWLWMEHWQLYCAYALYAVLLLGLIPWRGFRKNPERLLSSTNGRWWWLGLWILIPTAYFASTWIQPDGPLKDWYEYAYRFWVVFLHHDSTPKRIWEPRYMGLIIPAWLLWLGASIRRLPFVIVRTAAILFFAGVCAFSSLSNQLLYRNAPFNRVAAAVMRYDDPKNPSSMSVAVPQVAYPHPAQDASMEAALQDIPGTLGNRSGSAYRWSEPRTPAADQTWLRSMRNSSATKTIMLVDRDGDDVDASISDKSLADLMGPDWKLVDEESFQWHYEWALYIFHTWRLRVWQRNDQPARRRAAALIPF